MESGREAGTFGAFVQRVAATAQRREKLADHEVVDLTATWTIPTEPREKGNPGTLKLPPLAMKVLGRLPRMAGIRYVFHRPQRRPARRLLRPPFRFQDARRRRGLHIARFAPLLSQLAVAAPGCSDIAERVLGHAIVGVEGVYDRHRYRDEMADALRRLAR